jgi:hypothetical protein
MWIFDNPLPLNLNQIRFLASVKVKQIIHTFFHSIKGEGVASSHALEFNTVDGLFASLWCYHTIRVTAPLHLLFHHVDEISGIAIQSQETLAAPIAGTIDSTRESVGAKSLTTSVGINTV